MPPKPPADVPAFLATLEHPQKKAILALRELILRADKRIGESIKWNAPSFSTVEHFATFHLRGKDVQVVLHLGAKTRADTGIRAGIADDAKLLQWRGADRAIVSFRDLADVEAKRSAFTKIVKQWIGYLEPAR